ncbi:thiamine phosphate synthase [Geobacter sp. OR-1]|uniref:thiamine phosphate synthase n=1 Tax=Geobacter sp. OR-1 TaxID=1266765 RepID=UPI00126A49A2|nr:thiamine phosphate synthase [Geobacter sp. OR-1]
MMPVDFDLYLITDRHQAKSANLLETVEAALQGGVRAVQLREKDLPPAELYELAEALRQLTGRFQARLFINDRVDIAVTVGADGVHLGEKSIPVQAARGILGQAKLIGVSCHSLAGARSAEAAGADFITFGPVFFTRSKAIYGDPLGPEKLAAAAGLNIPVFGLGGITEGNIRQVLDAGASGIALISAIIAADQPQQATTTILGAIRHARQPVHSLGTKEQLP